MFNTLSEVKAANKAIGNHWFDQASMRFFRTRIESALIRGKYFITSEQFDDNAPRLYSVRQIDEHGGVSTLGRFQAYTTKREARQAIPESNQ